MAGSVFALSSAIGCAEAGHDTLLMMPDAGLSVDEALPYYGHSVSTLPARLRIALPASQRVGMGRASFVSTRRYYRAVWETLSREAANADAVVVRTLKLAHYLSSRPLPMPLVYEMHDWYADVDRKWTGAEWMISAEKRTRERRLSRMERETIPRLAGVIALRETTGALMRETYPDARVAVIPTGLRPPSRLPAVSAEPVVGYVGQLHRHKGLELLLDALALDTRLRALIVGGGDPLAELRGEAERRGLGARVEFTGHVAAAEVPVQMARARVGVLPLLDCFFNRYLTSPLKIMEYYAAGLPVVTPDAPVTREVVEHEATGLLTPFHDAGALAEALARLCFDGDLHARCRNNIEKRLGDYSWTRRGRSIAAFIAELRRT